MNETWEARLAYRCRHGFPHGDCVFACLACEHACTLHDETGACKAFECPCPGWIDEEEEPDGEG